MELMFFGDTLQVLQPKALADAIKEEHKKAYKLY
jgi:hypothetical protein